jgi:hypothetical protein
VCSFVCCVSFDRDVILYDVCYLFVVSCCIATDKYYIITLLFHTGQIQVTLVVI